MKELPYHLRHAVMTIADIYGDKVTVKPKTLLKFGRSEQVDNSTYTTLMELPSGVLNEVYATGNTIDTISSSSASDTGTVIIEGHTLSGSDLTFVSQTATLNGQNKVTLTTPLYRATRLANTGAADEVGDIYVYEDTAIVSGVPSDGTKVHVMIKAANQNNQSFKASTSISSQDYWIITQAFASINTKAGSPIAEIQIQVRQFGGVFRTAAIASVGVGGSSWAGFSFDPVIIVPANADVRMRALGSAAGLNVSGWMNGYLALKES